jgi:hypothetical protein
MVGGGSWLGRRSIFGWAGLGRLLPIFGGLRLVFSRLRQDLGKSGGWSYSSGTLIDFIALSVLYFFTIEFSRLKALSYQMLNAKFALFAGVSAAPVCRNSFHCIGKFSTNASPISLIVAVSKFFCSEAFSSFLNVFLSLAINNFS